MYQVEVFRCFVVRILSQEQNALRAFSLAEFIDEIDAAASLSAKMYGCTLRAMPVDPELAIEGTRDLLLAAVANLLQNAFKFTKPGTEVLLTATANGGNIFINVADHCGGLGHNAAESMFLPFTQSGADRTGIGLGLTIAKQSVTANRGELTVRDVAGHGCVFTISLPQSTLPP